jgi:hypothetical protein
MSQNDNNINSKIQALQKDIEYIKEMLKDLKDYFIKTKEENEKRFVTQDQFRPIKLIVYGMIGAILLAVLSDVISKR